MMRTVSESQTGGVEVPVLAGAAGVMTKEGHGLGEAEEFEGERKIGRALNCRGSRI